MARREGDADLLHRRLAGREEFFGGLEADPVRSSRAIDRGVFLRNLHRRRPEPNLDRPMLFLLATAKLNQAERFGVGLGENYGFNSGEDTPPERVYMELEEHYQTRLLAYVLDMFGLPFQIVAPPLVMRQFVRIAVFVPERLGFAFVGAAEIAGCVMFDELRRVGVELFADEPDVAARIERLYGEILTDELGHVGYCAARCTPSERAIMRWLYPRIGRLFARQTAKLPRSTSSPIRRNFTRVLTGGSMSRDSLPDCRTRRSLPHIPDRIEPDHLPMPAGQPVDAM